MSFAVANSHIRRDAVRPQRRLHKQVCREAHIQCCRGAQGCARPCWAPCAQATPGSRLCRLCRLFQSRTGHLGQPKLTSSLSIMSLGCSCSLRLRASSTSPRAPYLRKGGLQGLSNRLVILWSMPTPGWLHAAAPYLGPTAWSAHHKLLHRHHAAAETPCWPQGQPQSRGSTRLRSVVRAIPFFNWCTGTMQLLRCHDAHQWAPPNLHPTTVMVSIHLH